MHLVKIDLGKHVRDVRHFSIGRVVYVDAGVTGPDLVTAEFWRDGVAKTWD